VHATEIGFKVMSLPSISSGLLFMTLVLETKIKTSLYCHISGFEKQSLEALKFVKECPHGFARQACKERINS